MGSFVGYKHEQGMEFACGSSLFTKGFIYVLAVLAILMKLVSVFTIETEGWFIVFLLKLLYVSMSFVWFFSLALAIIGLGFAVRQFEEFFKSEAQSKFLNYIYLLTVYFSIDWVNNIVSKCETFVKFVLLCLPSVMLAAITYYSLSLHWLTRETMYCLQFEACVMVTVPATIVLLYVV